MDTERQPAGELSEHEQPRAARNAGRLLDSVRRPDRRRDLQNEGAGEKRPERGPPSEHKRGDNDRRPEAASVSEQGRARTRSVNSTARTPASTVAEIEGPSANQ